MHDPELVSYETTNIENTIRSSYTFRKNLLINLLFCYIFSFIANNAQAQWIYSIGGRENSSLPQLQRLNVSSKALVRISDIPDAGMFSDIAFHPNGALYGISNTSPVSLDSTFIQILDTLTGDFERIYTIYGIHPVGLTIDHKGIFYLGGCDLDSCAVMRFNSSTGECRVLAKFGPRNGRFINDLDFYDGALYMVGGLPAGYSERAILYKVDTTGADQHDTIRIYEKWSAYNLASISDSCGSEHLVSISSNLLNSFFPDSDSIFTHEFTPPPHIRSEGSTSRTSWLGSIPPLLIDSVTFIQGDPCAGNSDATVNVQIRPGRPPAVEFSLDGSTWQDSAIFHFVAPGIYQAFVRDDWGCSRMSDPFEIRTFNDPPSFSLSASAEHCDQQDGVIVVNALSGTPPYDFSLDNLSWQTDVVFSGLGSGTHSVFLRDSNGCIAIESIVVQTAEAPVITGISVSPSACGSFTGEVSISAHDGSGNLLYALDAGIFTNNPVFTGLSPGNHTIIVMDTAGCTADTIVMVGTTEGPLIESISSSDAHCGVADGSILVTASPLSGTIEYTLDGTTWQDSPAFNSLGAGIYHVAIRDTNGCMTTASVMIDDIPALSIDSIITVDASCGEANGSIVILPNTGAVNGYSLSNSAFQDGPVFENLAAGHYTIILQSYDACYDTAIVALADKGAPVFNLISVQDADCNGFNGAMSVSTSGGTGILVHAIDNLPAQQDTQFNSLASGEYIVTVTDSLGCTASVNVFIPKAEGIRIDFLNVTPADCGASNGSVEFAVSSQYPPIDVFLDNITAGPSSSFSGLNPGSYSFHVNDAQGCVYDSILTVALSGCEVFIPNVFSPNGDNINDLFGSLTNDPAFLIHTFEIWDRWGNIIFSCDGAHCAWDGTIRTKKAPAGVYVYRLLFSTSYDAKVERKGDVTLIR